MTFFQLTEHLWQNRARLVPICQLGAWFWRKLWPSCTVGTKLCSQDHFIKGCKTC